ncbi:MAG: hypothetical protein P4M01_13880 [Acidobacteriota bacterium]|nr:hypothetical protein [Acidobacteriota bacterium]
MQDAHTTAGLRGIHAVSERVAWASGTGGTVLRTVDGGSHWTACAVPPRAETLDFRGVWAWSELEAEVLASGPGEASRLYRTVDGCRIWVEELRNEDKDGFWDVLAYETRDFGLLGDTRTGVVIGDPVKGCFETKAMVLGHGWFIDEASCTAREGESAFAASNTSAFVFGSRRYILVTGGKGGPRALRSGLLAHRGAEMGCAASMLPLASGEESAGAFSVWFRDAKLGVVVGGDYKKPGEREGTAAWTADGGVHWTASQRPPRGYRSGVQWDEAAKAWIAVGTNGADASYDDGKTWKALDDGNWNAISWPFAVGPEGRIGKMSTPVR